MANEGRKDLDRLVIRMGGRDYKAANLIGGALLLLVGLGLLAYGAATSGPPGVFLAGAIVTLFGVGVTLGRAT